MYRVALGAGAVGSIGLSLWSIQTGASFAIGAAIGLGVLRSLEGLVRRYIAPGSERRTGIFLLLSWVRYPFLIFGFYLLLKAPWLNLFALIAGLGLPQIAILCAALRCRGVIPSRPCGT